MSIKKFQTTSSVLSTAVFILAVFILTLSGSGVTYGLDHSGNITSNETWSATDNPHVVTGNIHVYSSATLTIEPGCLVKFNAETALYIGYYSAAALNAVGTSGSPITFTSNESTPAPSDWKGIVFFNGTVDGSTIMDYCTVEYGGSDSYNSNINCNNASPTIQNCKIRNSDGYGIYTTGSGALPLISCSSLTNNDYGIFSTSDSNPTIIDCSITGNTNFGVYSDISPMSIDAENNWWGSADGPSGVASGSGDAVSHYVDYDPWRTAFDSCLETIVLSPASGTNIVGSQHAVTAEVLDESDNPVEGIVVSFVITAGPHAGQNGTDATDANGQATFNYTGTLEGTDTIDAGFVDFHGRTRTSNSVTMTWGPSNNPPVAMCRNVTVSADANCSANASVDDGSNDPDSGDTISVSQSPAGPYPLGETTVTLTATDNHDASSSCQATVIVVVDTPPTVTLNGAETMAVECRGNFTDPGATANDNCTGTVNVTTSGSVNPNVPGTYTITYSATDGTNTTTKTRTVEVKDTTASTITLKPSITYWPPNHKYKTVTVCQMVQGVSDGCDSVDISDVVIEQVTNDEPDNIQGCSDGNTRNDIVIAATCKSLKLRVERDGLKNGRVYAITLRVTDNSGNEAHTEFKVRCR
ncbi:MAG: hypothetical protein CV087_01850 [Candidatus Brocadia sp. WS118]|nr:MAG: hypothetical protein CV087_01850 [Candidatus Brocadia sp. WS118]